MKALISERERMLLSDYATRSFRNQADRDYLAARILWRSQLYHQFLWPALQAVEKYLKATLLFSCSETKSYGHDAAKALRAVKKLPRLKFAVPLEIEQFVEKLSGRGQNRYLDHSFVIQGDELLGLDWTVWHLRKYCQDFLLMPGDKTRYPAAESSGRLAMAWSASPSRPTSFSVQGGLLEKYLVGGPTPIRSALVWKNPCFGARFRRTLKCYPMPWLFEQPTQVMHAAEFLPLLEKLVSIRREVRYELEKRAAASAIDA